MTSRDFTIGVEEEYQLVNAETLALRSRARAVLEADWTGELKPELQETTLEIGTRVCNSSSEVAQELKRLRFQTGTAAASEGLAIAAAGIHPVSRWEGQVMTQSERYARIADHYGRLARDEHNFGMHIHVAVPEQSSRIRLMNATRFYLPHLLALSCSSPFHEASDTGYASFRMILWRRWPNSGIPPWFRSEAEQREYVDLLLRSGAIADEGNLYWSLRPHPTYPTLEFRVTDVCPTRDDAVAIAALARVIVAAAAEGILPEQPWSTVSTDLTHSLLAAGEWRAAKYGLETFLMDPAADSRMVTLRNAVRRLIEQVRPVTEELGEDAAVTGIEKILERGNGADRMRRVAEEQGSLDGVIAWVQQETMLGTGLDRRGAQRANG